MSPLQGLLLPGRPTIPPRPRRSPILRGSSAPPEPYTPPPREVVREVVYLPAYYPPAYGYYMPAYYLTLPFGIVRQHRHVATSTATMMHRK